MSVEMQTEIEAIQSIMRDNEEKAIASRASEGQSRITTWLYLKQYMEAAERLAQVKEEAWEPRIVARDFVLVNRQFRQWQVLYAERLYIHFRRIHPTMVTMIADAALHYIVKCRDHSILADYAIALLGKGSNHVSRIEIFFYHRELQGKGKYRSPKKKGTYTECKLIIRNAKGVAIAALQGFAEMGLSPNAVRRHFKNNVKDGSVEFKTRKIDTTENS